MGTTTLSQAGQLASIILYVRHCSSEAWTGLFMTHDSKTPTMCGRALRRGHRSSRFRHPAQISRCYGRRPSVGPQDRCLCHRAFHHPHLCQTPPPYQHAQALRITLYPVLPHSSEPLNSTEHILFFPVPNTCPLSLRPCLGKRCHVPLYCTIL